MAHSTESLKTKKLAELKQIHKSLGYTLTHMVEVDGGRKQRPKKKEQIIQEILSGPNNKSGDKRKPTSISAPDAKKAKKAPKADKTPKAPKVPKADKAPKAPKAPKADKAPEAETSPTLQVDDRYMKLCNKFYDKYESLENEIRHINDITNKIRGRYSSTLSKVSMYRSGHDDPSDLDEYDIKSINRIPSRVSHDMLSNLISEVRDVDIKISALHEVISAVLESPMPK